MNYAHIVSFFSQSSKFLKLQIFQKETEGKGMIKKDVTEDNQLLLTCTVHVILVSNNSSMRQPFFLQASDVDWPYPDGVSQQPSTVVLTPS